MHVQDVIFAYLKRKRNHEQQQTGKSERELYGALVCVCVCVTANDTFDLVSFSGFICLLLLLFIRAPCHYYTAVAPLLYY